MRLVYGLALVRNPGDYLLGIDRNADYFLPQRSPRAVTEHVTETWRERWAMKRVLRDDVLQRIAVQRLVHPIRKGARVVLPRTISDQRTLFEE